MSGFISLSLCILMVQCLLYITAVSALSCPKKSGKDPTDVSGRLQALVKVSNEFNFDDGVEFSYSWHICQVSPHDAVAILQKSSKLKGSVKDLGEYKGAQLIGGTDWFMITYPNGGAYGSHCNKQKRKSSVMVTCDPDSTKGTFKIIEEYRHSGNVSDDCYYLFELNNKAACTVKPTSLSPGSILLIVVLIIAGVYLVLGFLYQRFVAGAKGLEQIPHYNMWTAFGSLQADGCNFICRCREAKPKPRYKPVEDALSDDRNDENDDENLLAAV